jgi:copper resistance protein B
MQAKGWLASGACLAALAWPAWAQMSGVGPASTPAPETPVDDQRVYAHGLLDEFEGRFGDDQSFRWEGEGWAGGDSSRVWVKSEGELTNGRVEDGQQEAFYDRPITTYFDVQAGARYDLDSRPGRGWAALGIEGLAPFFFTVSATAYASDKGHYAAKLEASNEIRFDQRLILEPRIELNLYTRADPARRTGSGLSDLDAGLRLRYEISRKLAPYVGVIYQDRFARTARLVEAAGEPAGAFRLTIGIRSWF